MSEAIPRKKRGRRKAPGASGAVHVAKLVLGHSSPFNKLSDEGKTISSRPALRAAFGLLKGLDVFGEDSVQYQRALRDEWQRP